MKGKKPFQSNTSPPILSYYRPPKPFIHRSIPSKQITQQTDHINSDGFHFSSINHPYSPCLPAIPPLPSTMHRNQFPPQPASISRFHPVLFVCSVVKRKLSRSSTGMKKGRTKKANTKELIDASQIRNTRE
ncbi:hypothetical protein VTL71DRAFT_4426 [Oculimacula yallundae]|uniref:Uncharacterized protein n=1 Tax=Oculimacula yallundae TaxID=86028 RepID=A0ABR4C334_9HELO